MSSADFFLFMQKTAYELRISDWSSDVCSSDLLYITAEDVGTSVEDMQEVATVSRHVAGLPSVAGRAGGDPSPWTAKGVFESMQVAAEFALGRRSAESRAGKEGVRTCSTRCAAGH